MAKPIAQGNSPTSPAPHTSGVKIALLGRPNVGKSTLFNVLALGRENKAITHAQAGTTRDVRRTPAQLFGRPFILLDTAGIEMSIKQGATELQGKLNQLSRQAAIEADVLILMIDGIEGITVADRGLAQDLRKLDKPTYVVVNKADVKTAARTADEAESLGFGPAVMLSAAHREGLGDLEEALDAILPPVPEEVEPEPVAVMKEELDEEADLIAQNALHSRPVPQPLKMAILGRPNVGKSTLVNALLRYEAMLTGPVAGLTREAITHTFHALDHEFMLIDTPGLRKKGKIEDASLESLSAGQALMTMEHAHVLILVIDASVHNEAKGAWQVFEQQDATIAQAALHANKPLVVALNKWDAVLDKEACKADVTAQLRAKLHGIHTPLAIPISATQKQGLGALLKAIMQVQEVYGRAFGTAKLNRTLAAILARRSPPLVNGRPVSLKFLRQITVAPPIFALWGNRVDQIAGHYLQFLKHQLAENMGMTSLPITLHLRTNKNPFGDRKTKAPLHQAGPDKGKAKVFKAAVKPGKPKPDAEPKKGGRKPSARPSYKVGSRKSSKS